MRRKNPFIYVIEVKFPWKGAYEVPAGPQGVFYTNHKTALKALKECQVDLDPEKNCSKSLYRIVIYGALRDLHRILANEAIK